MFKIIKGSEIIKQVSQSIQFFECTDDFCVLLNMLNGLEKCLGKMVVVPEEKWLEIEKAKNIIKDLVKNNGYTIKLCLADILEVLRLLGSDEELRELVKDE